MLVLGVAGFHEGEFSNVPNIVFSPYFLIILPAKHPNLEMPLQDRKKRKKVAIECS